MDWYTNIHTNGYINEWMVIGKCNARYTDKCTYGWIYMVIQIYKWLYVCQVGAVDNWYCTNTGLWKPQSVSWSWSLHILTGWWWSITNDWPAQCLLVMDCLLVWVIDSGCNYTRTSHYVILTVRVISQGLDKSGQHSPCQFYHQTIPAHFISDPCLVRSLGMILLTGSFYWWFFKVIFVMSIISTVWQFL